MNGNNLEVLSALAPFPATENVVELRPAINAPKPAEEKATMTLMEVLEAFKALSQDEKEAFLTLASKKEAKPKARAVNEHSQRVLTARTGELYAISFTESQFSPSTELFEVQRGEGVRGRGGFSLVSFIGNKGTRLDFDSRVDNIQTWGMDILFSKCLRRVVT